MTERHNRATWLRRCSRAGSATPILPDCPRLSPLRFHSQPEHRDIPLGRFEPGGVGKDDLQADVGTRQMPDPDGAEAVTIEERLRAFTNRRTSPSRPDSTAFALALPDSTPRERGCSVPKPQSMSRKSVIDRGRKTRERVGVYPTGPRTQSPLFALTSSFSAAARRRIGRTAGAAACVLLLAPNQARSTEHAWLREGAK